MTKIDSLLELMESIRDDAGLEEGGGSPFRSISDSASFEHILLRDTAKGAVDDITDTIAAAIRGVVGKQYHAPLKVVMREIYYTNDTKQKIKNLVYAILRATYEESKHAAYAKVGQGR